MRLRFTRRAEHDLIDIWKYLARERPLTADEIVRRIDRLCHALTTTPAMGRRRPEIAPDVRSFPVERWVIFYRVRDDEVLISRIVDGARDIRLVHVPKG